MSPAEMESHKMVEVEAAADPEERTASGDPKACDDCNTTKTPLWRGGPNGPKSLCNACGIRYRKRRRVAMGLDPEAKRKPKRDDAALSKAEASSTKEEEEEEEEKASTNKIKTKTTTHTVELHMVGFAKDAVLKQRRRMRMRRRKPSCLGEEERAAILLMSLSSGVIYA
ncbi:GATA transcription factor 17-like [Triticum dicoccoides]|uniref:GATA transcription factor 17-like n=1 Tax=Triticum dicoccoides TaxID=85692 RepID=UPI00188EFFAF|nr:GATA transcription factor 17-like [Triticum dicoccoides]